MVRKRSLPASPLLQRGQSSGVVWCGKMGGAELWCISLDVLLPARLACTPLFLIIGTPHPDVRYLCSVAQAA
eukprot:9838018-Prorocentrum_lima.AAC.1